MISHQLSHVTPRTAARLPVSLRFLLLLCAALCASGHAQTPTPEEDEVLNVRTDLVTIPVFVTDSRGRRVAGLRATDFGVLAAGRPVEISYFAAGTSRVALVFALDASGSAREHIGRQREAALSLFSQFGKGSRVAVLAFADTQDFTLPFSTDIAGAPAAFQIRARGNRRTAIFDAALAAARAFDEGAADRAERRIVLLLSDGLDTASRTRAPAVVAEAVRRGVSFYVLHLPLYTPRWNGLAVRRPAEGFRTLADRTGGKYFLLGDEKQALAHEPNYDLAPIFRAIADDLQSQYVLGFYADEAARAAGEHKLEVRLNEKKNSRLRVHALREKFNLKTP
ncbi:MAG: VWA domain-containing protein [Acidobacteria bacterium]|nr:VWA domain-containing protein [Acidobacteriota bacterium]